MEEQKLQPISSPTAVKIVDAAGHLFMQKGYKAVSINDIIRAADVTKPTLYYYFADKEELFVQMGLRVTAEMGERLRAAAATPGDLAARLRALAAALMGDGDKDMRMMRHEMFEHLGPSQRSRLARAFFLHIFSPVLRVMEEGAQAGELAGYPPITLAKMFMAMAESFQEFGPRAITSNNPHHDEMFGSPDIDTAALINLFLYGVAGDALR
jgi:AcrR family transcriptional regulator